VIFGLSVAFDETAPSVASNRLIISEDDARRLVWEFEAVWRRPPTIEELDHLIDELLREEVYMREAVALGLDQNDAVIRRRLQTKMEFLTESGAEAVEPDDDALQAHLDRHPERFSKPELIAFDQVLLQDDMAEAELKQVKTLLNTGHDPRNFASASLLPAVFDLSPPRVIDGSFGTGFFDGLSSQPVGQWFGPVKTSLGHHMIRLTDRRAAHVPQLSEVRDQVERDWRAEFMAKLREDRYQALLSRYEVERPRATDVLER
jgi:hypothetical protein